VSDEDVMLETVEKYFRALVSSDGDAAADLFTEDGVIDDGGGRQWMGSEKIRGFIGRPRNIRLEVPLRVLPAPGRLGIYGHLTVPEGHEVYQLVQEKYADQWLKFRWVFHFSGSRISHLSNSFVRHFPETPETVPFSV
jgi:SnoaL-like domain